MIKLRNVRRLWLIVLLAGLLLAFTVRRVVPVLASEDPMDASDLDGDNDLDLETDDVPNDSFRKEAVTAEPTATVDPSARGGSYAPPALETQDGAVRVLLAETFQDNDDTIFSRWVRSIAPEYDGVWAVGGGINATIPGDKALIVTRKARKYGIVREAHPGAFDRLVLQYEVKHEDGHSCSGAYVKLPAEPFGASGGLAAFNSSVPYSIMFGPDKCGGTNKVHFIFQSRNPITGTFVEHHLQNAPTMPHEIGQTHVYTLDLDIPSAKYRVLVDNVEKKRGSLAEDFSPPLQPPETIDDPKDSKPKDWVDEKMIPDPEARKPSDWNENAPKEISDPTATQPAGWLENEPEKIPDPEAVKPSAWDDEEDGEWSPPLIPNPRCERAPGCGKWKAPLIPNPAYKGKWKAPMIKNPAYKGEWKPRNIPNPEYYKVKKIDILPIAGVGIEIWTMDQGILFDNVLLMTGSGAPNAVSRFAEATWARKVVVEKEREEARNAKRSKTTASTSDSMRSAMLRVAEFILIRLEFVADAIETLLAKVGLDAAFRSVVIALQRQPLIAAALLPPLIVAVFIVMMGTATKNKYSEKKRPRSSADRHDDAGAKKSEHSKPNIPTENEEEISGEPDDEIDEKSDATTSASLRKRPTRPRKQDSE